LTGNVLHGTPTVPRHAKNSNGWTALHLAAEYGREEVMQLLLDKGSDVAAKDTSGRTALDLAAEYGHRGVVLLLLHKGSDVVAKDNKWTNSTASSSFPIDRRK